MERPRPRAGPGRRGVRPRAVAAVGVEVGRLAGAAGATSTTVDAGPLQLGADAGAEVERRGAPRVVATAGGLDRGHLGLHLAGTS